MGIRNAVTLLLVVICATALSFAQAPCDKLKSLSLPDTKVTAVEFVPAGTYIPPAFPGAPAAKPQQGIPLPPYCRVALALTPSSDSHIESEVWLPPENWNGKLQVVGNGGWAGTISFSAMAGALREGYATASTDTGRKPNDGGGKLLLYHGWSDPGIAAGNTVNYYKSVLSKMGPKQDDWLRLFMIPGMQHCSGGRGTDQFNKMGAIERWRELGIAPDQILAAHVTGSTVDMTRPLCPYPKTAVYRGSGSTADAANFTCK